MADLGCVWGDFDSCGFLGMELGEMNGLPLETQGQLAAGVALLSLIFGAASWELMAGALRWIGRATIAAGVLQLMAFSQYAVRQYHVLVVKTNIPLVEVATNDSGRERTIERVHAGDDTILEREHIAGWRLATAAGHRYTAGRPMLQRTEAAEGSDCSGESCRRCNAGCSHGILGVQGCSGKGCSGKGYGVGDNAGISSIQSSVDF